MAKMSGKCLCGAKIEVELIEYELVCPECNAVIGERYFDKSRDEPVFVVRERNDR